MSERKKDQLGLKRKKRSCVSSMRSTVILKVCFRLFALHVLQLLDGGADFILALTFFAVPDIVETLLPLLNNPNRTRRHVVTQLVHMGLVDSAKELKKPKYVLHI